MTNNIDINASLWAAVSHCVSTEETRYYLHGTYIEPHPMGGVTMVATDGHLLAVAHDPTGTVDAPLTLKGTWKDKVLKPARGENASRRLVATIEEEGRDTLANVTAGQDIGVTFGGLMVQAIAGTFPDWRGAWPDAWRSGHHPAPGESPVANGLMLDPALLDTVTRAARTADPMHEHVPARAPIWLSFAQAESFSPVVVRTPVPGIVFLVMPGRASVSGSIADPADWLAPVMAAG